MAKVVLLADIHANLPALLAVMKELEEVDADFVLCAGDVVGYGPQPNECCSIVCEAVDHAIQGNHDESALCKDTTAMNPYAAAALLWTADNLDSQARRFLTGLPSTDLVDAGGTTIALHHGSPRDPYEYVYEDEVDEGLLECAGADILVLGHTHFPFVRSFPRGMVVNPGSVGQPRDGDPRASYAVLDTTSGRCEITRVAYPVEQAAEAIIARGLPVMLAQRLSFGR